MTLHTKLVNSSKTNTAPMLQKDSHSLISKLNLNLNKKARHVNERQIFQGENITLYLNFKHKHNTNLSINGTSIVIRYQDKPSVTKQQNQPI